MAALTVQEVALAGLNPSYSAAAGGGDTFVNDGKTFFHVKNGSGSSVNVTFTAQDTTAEAPGFGEVTVSDTVVAVPASGERIIGFFPKTRFNNANGAVAVAYSAATSVTVAAIKTERPQQ